jgi:hypothetical protein
MIAHIRRAAFKLKEMGCIVILTPQHSMLDNQQGFASEDSYAIPHGYAWDPKTEKLVKRKSK